ncbi:YdbH family protein [Glaesserella parasuis]|nr:YdbH family protein [Glaesserella parasuis]MDP0053052.1 YdbH family protein [Glaesserella parasuis]
MLRRSLLIIGAVLAILMAGGASLLSGSQLASAINLSLPTGWKIETPDGIEPHLEKAILPQFTLYYQNCPIVSADRLAVQWIDERSIRLNQATIDYACLTLFPKSEKSQTDPIETIKTIFALLPEGSLEIQSLAWKNLPDEMHERLKGLLQSPSEIKFAFFQQKLTAYIKQQAVTLDANFANQQLSAQLSYQPNKDEQHLATLSAQLDEHFLALPQQLSLNYQWNLPKTLIAEPSLQQGHSTLSWHKQDQQLHGNWQLNSAITPENQFNLPFRFDTQSLTIDKGKIDWQLSNDFPLNAYLTTTITPNRFSLDALYPIKTAVRISLLTQNAKGKGNVVISSPQGEIQQDSLLFPLQITGNIKQGDYILYSSVPLDLRGKFDDLTLRFLQGALLRLTGTERFLTINDLRFPLAGVRVDKQGIHGRLQAIFRGESPDFKNIEMRLDGYANNFKAGALHFFQDPTDKKAVKDQWNWRFWGSSQIKALNRPLAISGRGLWHKDLVQLSEFKGSLDHIRKNGVFIPQTELVLDEPINFEYDKFHLTGGVKLSASQMDFAYGGLLEKPTANLKFYGEVENLNFRGDVTANKLGPIKLFARRKLTNNASDLIGKLYWSEQPANVFQSLFPFRNQWVITNGTIKGETAFSANAARGLMAGGHFAIRNGAVSLPNGEIKGIDFSLPYQYKQGEVDIGVKKALDVNIDEVNMGIPITNVKVKIQGHLPYTKRKPLFLRELSLNLLDGRLNIEHFALPQTKIAYLKLFDIRFERILELAQYHQLDLTGKFNGIFPFWLSGKPCYICNGTLTQADRSYLKFTPELLEAIKQGGYTEQILAYMVNKSEIDDFTATVNLDSKGDMDLSAKIHSRLTEHKQAKVNLNYNHKENMFDLWKLINYGSQFEQNIEHSIYKQLDKQ